MTETEAIALATQYLAALPQEHAGLVEARFLEAARLNAIVGYQKFEGDIWVVDFSKQLAEGVVVESPATISVIVVTTSRRVFILPSP
jgi:hypothetical protein